ncbi:MAG TPA: alpha/beta hydrolase [Gammaproteobacteria bacterium]|nr:alpha/beta hydrolase [Gammaproteobacteria bacterium]
MKTTYCNQWMTGLVLTALLALAGCAAKVLDDKRLTTATVESTDGSPIVYGVRGQGEPTLVFVHCWTCNHTFWDAQIEYFARDHRVIWLDLAGHGESGSHRQRYTMQAFGQDVAAVVRQVGARNVILVGHSMGGPVAVEAAKQLGDRVIGIVGVDTFYTPFEYPASQEAIAAFVKPFETDFHGTSDKMLHSMFTPQADPAVVDAIVDKFSAADPEVGVSAMYELFDWNAHQAPADLQRFSGILYNINAAPTGEEAPPNAHVVMVPGVGHFVAQVKPAAFNQALEGIIARLTGTGDPVAKWHFNRTDHGY